MKSLVRELNRLYRTSAAREAGFTMDASFASMAARLLRIKAQMLQQLSNFGQPFIYVVDANYLNRGELLLGHRHEGVDLKADYARDTLRSLERVWRRPVSLLTILDDKPKRIRFDGSEISMADEPHAFRV